MIENESPTMAEVIKKAVLANILDLHVCLPGRVEKYDHTRQKADVKPLLKKRYKGNSADTEYPVIPSVPVQWPAANNGAAYIHLPLAAGDFGIILICERSLDSWLSGEGKITSPADPRHHDLSDAIFIPGIRPWKKALVDTSATNAIFQNGSLRIEMSPAGKISISGVYELLTVISDLIDHLISATVEHEGPKPLSAGTIASLTADKAKIDALKL
jgi:hypothetical protein